MSLRRLFGSIVFVLVLGVVGSGSPNSDAFATLRIPPSPNPLVFTSPAPSPSVTIEPSESPSIETSRPSIPAAVPAPLPAKRLPLAFDPAGIVGLGFIILGVLAIAGARWLRRTR